MYEFIGEKHLKKSESVKIDSYTNDIFERRGSFITTSQDVLKVPPQTLESEEAVLGALLIDKEATYKVIPFLSEDVFYKSSHKKVFNAIVSLFEKGEPIDTVTATNELKKHGELENVGGVFFVVDLSGKVTSGANAEYHANAIIEKYLLREIISKCGDVIQKAYTEKGDVFRLLDEVESQVFKLYEKGIKQNYADSKTVLHETMQELEVIHNSTGELTGVPTGFKYFDELTAGLQKSDLIILAGRPGQGKTALALNISRNATVEHNVHVGFFSLEMSRKQLMQRLMSAEACVNLRDMRKGSLTDKQFEIMNKKAANSFSSSKLFIDDTPAIPLLELRAKARRMKREKNIGLIIVDYLQLMRGPKDAHSREREISMISGGLKALAKELDIPVLALSQMNRQVENRNDKRPQLSDLRESGAIEQDADLVCFVHRPELYKMPNFTDGNFTAGVAEIIIAKARNGPTGDFRLRFEKEYTKFSNWYPNHITV